MKKNIIRIISMILSIVMIITLNWGVGVQQINVYATTTGQFNIDTDTLPYTQDEIFAQLFDINNKINIKLDIPDEELRKLDSDYHKYEYAYHKSPIYRKADMYITITTAKDSYTYVINEVGVRLKGNTSRTSFYSTSKGMYNLVHFKVSFKETFDDELYYTDDAHVWGEDGAGQKLRKVRKKRTFATLEKMDMKWNRNFDTTYMREYYAYETFRANGVLAPHTNIASIDISKDHAGVYAIYEPIDDIFINKNLDEADQGGDLYKCGWDSNAPNLTPTDSIGVEDEENAKFYEYDLKTNKKKSDNSSLKNLLNGLNSNSLTKAGIAKLVDMDSFLKFAAVSYFTGNPDDMRNNYNNYYIYFLKSSGKAIFIPYDLDRCFGVTNGWNPTRDGMTGVSPFSSKAEGEGNGQSNPLFRYSVCPGGFYISEYAKALKKVAASEWLTTAKFNSIYSIVQKNYKNDVKPDKDYENGSRAKFYLDNSTDGDLSSDNKNALFRLFINAIMKTYNKEIAKTNNYMVAPLYLRGDFTNWQVNDKYQMDYDPSAKKYSYTVSSNKALSFKVNNGIDGDAGEWFGYDYIVSKPSQMVITIDSDNNIHSPAGTYTIIFDAAKHEITIKLPEQKIYTKYESITRTYGTAFGTDVLGARVTKGNGTISYSTSDSNVISYNRKTGKFEPKRAGTAYIYVYASETKVYARTLKKIKVTINKKTQTITGTKNYSKYYGTGTFTLNAVGSGKGRLTYSTSNKSVATVSSKGVVTMKGYGTATITVKAAATRGYTSATAKITVRVLPRQQKVTAASKTRGTIRTAWIKDSKVNGYQITYSARSDFKTFKNVTVSSKSTNAKTITKLSRGKSYYVKVRSYIRIRNKNYYGKYSNIVKVKVK